MGIGQLTGDQFIQNYLKCNSYEEIENFRYNSRRLFF